MVEVLPTCPLGPSLLQLLLEPHAATLCNCQGGQSGRNDRTLVHTAHVADNHLVLPTPVVHTAHAQLPLDPGAASCAWNVYFLLGGGGALSPSAAGAGPCGNSGAGVGPSRDNTDWR